MIRLSLIKLLINLFDYFQQKKVYNFLKKKINSGAVLFDVGAHHGETIKKFVKYFNYLSIHSFEASVKNYKILSKRFNNSYKINIFVNNFGLSDVDENKKINQFKETSSTTLSKINVKSNYYRKKIRILGLKDNINIFDNFNVKLDLLDNYCNKKNIKKIDLLKIDTEGHEYYVIKGSLRTLQNIKLIYFEHHYDDMLEKGYTFSDIHNLLKRNNFTKVHKSKMFFRKTFEYIYENINLH